MHQKISLRAGEVQIRVWSYFPDLGKTDFCVCTVFSEENGKMENMKNEISAP